MKQFQSGNLLIRAAGEKLQFEIDGEPGAVAEVPLEDLSIISEFIQSHRESHSNRRTGFRLDLDQLKPEDYHQIRVSVAPGGSAPLAVAPADLSLTGIRVYSDELTGEPGMQADITIAFESLAVTLPAVLVRRYDGDTRFAFHFPEIFGEDGRLKPPAAFTDILYALKSLWLNQNLDFKWNLA